MPFFAIAFLIAFLMLPPLAADCGASPPQHYILNRNETLPAYAVGQKMNGRCAWYGQRGHGNKTASGRPFDGRALTAAPTVESAFLICLLSPPVFISRSGIAISHRKGFPLFRRA